MTNTCFSCNSANLTLINTYKRVWAFCHSCGDATPTQKDRYLLEFLPEKSLRRASATEASVYDYFTDRDHIEYSIATAQEFLERFADPNKLSFADDTILDISGGNGHFIAEIAKLRGAHAELTEINEPAIDYARRTHGIPVYKYNFNDQRLKDVIQKEYDVIMARAAIMFCKDLSAFAEDCYTRLKPNGMVIINHSVVPTLGTVIRVQLDEFSYHVLRQPENVIERFTARGFDIVNRTDETDSSMYVYAHDQTNYWQLVHWMHEIPAVRRFIKAENTGLSGYSFRARDRRRSTMIFRKRV